jgi:Mycothiol maleylpyruvate isomerase N-terminal domain
MEQLRPKAMLIAELSASRTELESVVSHAPIERMTEPGACGSWSVKDVLAHLAVENDWLALQLERRVRGEVPGPEELQRVQELGLADNETRNTYYAQQHKDLDLAYVRDWDRRANERLLIALAALPEACLLEPDWWTFGRALGSVFDLEHDREHAQGIQRWLGQG